jgi:uncharacterized protein YunC (DUF1805 family)
VVSQEAEKLGVRVGMMGNEAFRDLPMISRPKN